MLFNSATYLFTSYSNRDVGFFVNSSLILSWLFIMTSWVPERGRNTAYEVIIKAFYEGFYTQGFTDWFHETSNLWMELIGLIWGLSPLHQQSRELVHTPRYTWQRQWYHMTGVSAQLLGSHSKKKVWGVEPIWCNHRGTRHEKEKIPKENSKRNCL